MRCPCLELGGLYSHLSFSRLHVGENRRGGCGRRSVHETSIHTPELGLSFFILSPARRRTTDMQLRVKDYA